MNKKNKRVGIFQVIGFLPYLGVVFLNAFTDLGHKIIIQNTIFKVYDGSEQVILTGIVNALILLPFILLFSPAGYLSDRYKKEKVMQLSALFAVVITCGITLSYYGGFFWVSFFLTFLLAVQSALYSPAKYGYIKELLGTNKIASGNGAVQAVTIVAILMGIVLYSVGFEYFLGENQTLDGIVNSVAPLGFFLIGGSLIELYLAYRLPEKTPLISKRGFDMKEYIVGGYLKKNLKLLKTNKIVYLCILGLSLFWGVSQVVLAVFPAYIKESLGISNVIVVQGLMGLSAIGIVIGSIVGAKISKNYIELGMIPVASFGIFVSIGMIPFLDSEISHGINFLLFGIFGGLLLVPLNSLIQYHAASKRLGLILSGNNFVQNVVMLSFLIVTVLLGFLTIDTTLILYILALVAFFGASYAIILLPQSMVRLFIASLFALRYKLIVQGIENIPQNKGVLLLGNHISWLDWAFVQMASPRPIRFVMERSIYEKRFIKNFLDFFGVIPISSSGGKKSLDSVADYLQKGEVVCIFPEGTISRSGHLGEFRRGFELAAAQVESGVIVPFYINGLWGTKWSRSSSNFKENTKTTERKNVIISFGAPIAIGSAAQDVKRSVFELSVESWNLSIESYHNIDRLVIAKAKTKGSMLALVDESGEYSYRKMIVLSLLFRDQIKKYSTQNIGLLLPTTAIGAIMNLATLLAGKTAVNLNYTASKDSLAFALKEADIGAVFTSRRFLTKLKEKGIETDFLSDTTIVIALEDLKPTLSKFSYLAYFASFIVLPSFLLESLYSSSNRLDSIGAILFSSGSEGAPKGVMLTHRNLITNIKQIGEMLNITDKEVFLGSLPIFHAFGLTVTTLLPIVEGIMLALTPDPTDGYAIGKVIAKNRVTFMCATSTFIRLYLKNKKLNPLMFESLNMVFAGAEKLNSEVAQEFKQKFGVSVYEGYGATECSPVISANIPDNLDMNYWQIQQGTKVGTIGMPLPGCAVRIIDPMTHQSLSFGEDGLIVVSGSHVMAGYLHNEAKTAEVFIELDGKRWYKTGDKGHIDSDGFITIVDRYSRFAKIGGEMISLTALENKIYPIVIGEYQDCKLVCVSLSDEKKGEKIVLLINYEIENLRQKLLEGGIEPLWLPAAIVVVEDVPLLGSGKIDFAGAKKLAIEALG